MKAIISRYSVNGNIPEVGMNDRVLVTHYKTLKSVENFAKRYALGKPYRIELFKDNRFYAEPYKIIIGI